MESGTNAALLSERSVDDSAVQLRPDLACLPNVANHRRNDPGVVHFKVEKGALTYGLGPGTIGDFNSRIVGFKGFSQ